MISPSFLIVPLEDWKQMLSVGEAESERERTAVSIYRFWVELPRAPGKMIGDISDCNFFTRKT